MNKLHHLSVRARIILITTTILIMAQTLTYVSNRRIYIREYTEATLIETTGLAQSLRFQLERIMELGLRIDGIVGFEKQCRNLVRDHESIDVAMVQDHLGTILFHNDPSRHGQILSVPTITANTDPHTPVVHIIQDHAFDMPFYRIAIPVFGNHDEVIVWVTVGFPVARITDKIREGLIYSLVFLGLSLCLAVGFQVLALSKWVTAPLGKLLAVIADIRERGSHSTQVVNLGSTDEFGQLAAAFDEMIQELRKSHQEIQSYTHTLEKKVEERTAVLQTINQQLSQKIAQRDRIELQLQASLEEKEVLLKEIHHRVKNNLQVISSLLHLQAPLLRDEHDRALFQESQQRVKTMSLIHEKLYRSDNLSQIDAKEYITTLVHDIYHSYASSTAAVTLNIDIAKVYWDIDIAIPCGLIINELVTNAVKYAFPKGTGTITVILSAFSDAQKILQVSDNGIGLPQEFSLDNPDSLGLELVRGLTEEQLHAELIVERDTGTTFRIIFPDNSEQWSPCE